MLQRHLLCPSLADLQVECGQSLQSASKLQIGSNGGSQTISTSFVTSDEILELNGNVWFSLGPSPPFAWIKNIRVFGSIPVTRYVPLGAMKLNWPEVVLQ